MSLRSLNSLRSLALALPLVACGPATPSGNPDAGTTPGEPKPAYFGLVDKQCLLFTDDYSILIQENKVAISGKTVFTLTHNKQGFPVQVDYVEPTGEGLRLHRRDESVAGGQPSDKVIWRFSDGPVMLTEELSVGEPLESTTATIREQPGQAQETLDTVVKTEMLEQVDVTAAGETFAAQRLIFSIVKESIPERTDRLWFAPNHGLVKLDPHGSDLKEVTFTGFKTLDPTSSGTQRFCMKD